MDIDKKIFRTINHQAGRHPFLDLLMISVSNKGRYLYVLVLIILWFRNHSQRKTTINAIISSLLALGIHRIISFFYFRPRPFMKYNVRFLIPSKKNSSFPSKHTLLTFSIATSIFLGNRVLGIFMWLLSLLMGFSRIWVGHHYPSDVLGSAILGHFTSILLEKARN